MNSQKMQFNQKEENNLDEDVQQMRSRSRSRQKVGRNRHEQRQRQSRNSPVYEKLQAGQMHYHQYIQKEEEFHENQQVLRSFLRIQQGRQQPIDKFVKSLYIYKGKYDYDPRLHQLMTQPKKFLNRLSLPQLEGMIVPTKRHLTSQQKSQDERFVKYWQGLLNLIEYKVQKKQQTLKQALVMTEEHNLEIQDYEIKQKIKNMLNKSEDDLIKLRKKVQLMLRNSSFGMDMSYWHKVKMKIKGKLLQIQLKKYYQSYKQRHQDQIQLVKQHDQGSQDLRQPISPILQPFSSVNPKLLISEEQQVQQRHKLSENIFRDQFQKHKQKLQINLSLPKNHNLLSKQLTTESTKTYDLITQQIMQFQKYKRMQQDEEQFDDWVPVQTEGRFRDRKPEYINRMKVSYDWTRYGQSGVIKQKIDEKQPPPKQVQGYKFNVFYPDLFDKEKTPQYYLEPLEDPNYMMIKFKAGPPYKDIAFKILRKEWDFTQKSGFQAIFTKGILQLYFNFKKPKFRI